MDFPLRTKHDLEIDAIFSKHLQNLHELLLLPESVLELADPLVLLVLDVAPVQVVHALTP